MSIVENLLDVLRLLREKVDEKRDGGLRCVNDGMRYTVGKELSSV